MDLGYDDSNPSSNSEALGPIAENLHRARPPPGFRASSMLFHLRNQSISEHRITGWVTKRLHTEHFYHMLSYRNNRQRFNFSFIAIFFGDDAIKSLPLKEHSNDRKNDGSLERCVKSSAPMHKSATDYAMNHQQFLKQK
jgi:hypothetical protein